MSWRDHAECVGDSDVFVRISKDPRWGRALAICDRCPVKVQCRAEALALPSEATRYSVWGGMTPAELRAARRRRDRRVAS